MAVRFERPKGHAPRYVGRLPEVRRKLVTPDELGFRIPGRRLPLGAADEDTESKLDKKKVQSMADKIVSDLLRDDKKQTRRSFQDWLVIEQDRQAESRAKLAAKQEEKRQQEAEELARLLQQQRPKVKRPAHVRRRERKEFFERQQHALERLEQQRTKREEELEQEAVAGCTFKPTIHSHGPRHRSRFLEGVLTNPEPRFTRLESPVRADRSHTTHTAVHSRGGRQAQLNSRVDDKLNANEALPRQKGVRMRSTAARMTDSAVYSYARRGGGRRPGLKVKLNSCETIAKSISKDSDLVTPVSSTYRHDNRAHVRSSMRHSDSQPDVRTSTKQTRRKVGRPRPRTRTLSVDSDLNTPRSSLPHSIQQVQEKPYVLRPGSPDSDLGTPAVSQAGDLRTPASDMPSGSTHGQTRFSPPIVRSASQDSDLVTPRTTLPRAHVGEGDLDLSRELIRSYSKDSVIRSAHPDGMSLGDYLANHPASSDLSDSEPLELHPVMNFVDFEQLELEEPPAPFIASE